MTDSSTLQPSTQWAERVAPGEAERFAGYGAQFAEIQKRKSARYGDGRALHRKQLLAARGTLQVLTDLPPFAAHGLFAQSGEHALQVRLSNGGMDKASDGAPDIRGFALRVALSGGDSALGNGPAVAQDFTLINHEAFAFPSSAEFVDFVVAASNGNGALIRFLIKRYGLFGAFGRVAQMARTMGQAFGGFATESFFSAAPIACGPYAVRVRLVPDTANGPSRPDAKKDWGADLKARLKAGPLHYELQLQPYVSEALTPIEDPTVNWPTPYTTVGHVALPQQDLEAPAGQALAAEVEKNIFDPWQALAAHRPLGDVMRARKVVYFESQKGRGAA
jgi:hypothetical protein